MHRKTYVVPLRDMMSKSLPDPAQKPDSDTIPNVFTKVPKFLSEEDMKEYVIQRLNTSKIFPHMGFVALSCESNHASYDDAMKVISCDTQEESRRTMIWRLNHSLLVVCKLNPVNEDSSDEGFQDNKLENDRSMEGLDQMLPCVELAFKYQQRQFIFVVFFLDYHARVVRFDRSGIIASEKIDYTKCGSYLTEFFVRYSRLQPADRGHDPTATRILPTDSLASQLKQRGADAAERDSEDHVQKLFNNSLDPQWPWWKLSVPDEESGVTRWFAVGEPHFCADGVMGRGTRGYVAAPLNAKGDGVDPQAKFVYLKDAWHVDHEGMEKEGTVLKALNDAKVPYVPTLLYHGDLAHQKTMSYELWPDFHKAETHEGCPLKSHQHYRLVVAEVGKPLSEFENGFQLVWALFCCISAHEKACEAGYIHRDISAGNILLYKGASGRWVGLLNDWELSKEFAGGATAFGGRQLDRTGTWQFMSVNVLLEPTELVGIPDDLESFFHVLIYFAVRFLPHNLADDLVGRFLYSYFDDYTDGASGFTCGLLKYNAIKRGVIDLTPISGRAVGAEGKKTTRPLTFFTADADADGEDDSVAPRKSHPINALIAELLDAFQALYAKEDALAVRSTDNDDTRGMSLPPGVMDLVQQMKAKRSQGASTSTSTSRTRSTDNAILADKVKAHEPMKMLILEHFDEQKWKWPEHDKGKDKKPREGYYVPAKENTAMALAFQTGSKRGAEDGEEPNSKRVRNRA